MGKYKSNPFYVKITGDYALFTDPMTKGGGEKFSYQVPTYQALKGIIEACYWKPTLYYIIDSVKVMKPIITETKGILSPLNSGKTDLSYYTYLRDVEYLVKFHFEWNELRNDLDYDRNEKKHEQILLRSMQRGGRRDVFLGVRECIAKVERIRNHDYDNAISYYNDKNISYGIMFHSFSYPDENYNIDSNSNLVSRFHPTVMINGEIKFVHPQECSINHILGEYSVKKFNKDNLMSVDELLEVYEKEGVLDCELDERTS